MSAGKRAILREEKRQERERRKRIELANKMLIPVSKKTTETLGILSFDPSGTFRLNDKRYLKVYSFDGDYSGLVENIKSLNGRIRVSISTMGDGGRATCHITLMESGEIYEAAREKLEKDEAVLRMAGTLTPLSVDETMQKIAANFGKEVGFNYASYVRGNKDWRKECLNTVQAGSSDFTLKDLYGKGFINLIYPSEITSGFLDEFLSLSCPMSVVMDLNPLSEGEQGDFLLGMEKSYNRRLLNRTEDGFFNLSVSLVFFCDSEDAMRIVGNTIEAIALAKGLTLAPAFNMQAAVVESALTYGLIDYKVMRNVSEKTIYALLGGEEDADAKIKI